MTTYTYLGYGTTDSTGKAKLDHDANGDPLSHSYTGVGAGELDVLASLDNPVVEGSVVSQTCTVYDCTWLDKGTDTEYNNEWVFISCTSDIRTRSPTGTTLDITGVTQSGNKLIMCATTNQYQNYLPNDTCIEFDVVEVDNKLIRFKDIARDTNRGAVYPTLDLSQYTTPFKLKVILKSDSVEFLVNDVREYILNDFTGATSHRPYFEILDGNYGKYIKYKDFKIYPI